MVSSQGALQVIRRCTSFKLSSAKCLASDHGFLMIPVQITIFQHLGPTGSSVQITRISNQTRHPRVKHGTCCISCSASATSFAWPVRMAMPAGDASRYGNHFLVYSKETTRISLKKRSKLSKSSLKIVRSTSMYRSYCVYIYIYILYTSHTS